MAEISSAADYAVIAGRVQYGQGRGPACLNGVHECGCGTPRGAYFGTYSVAEGGTVNLKVEASTYPNMTGTEPQRSIKLSGDALTWRNAAPAVGAGVAEQIWKRAD